MPLSDTRNSQSPAETRSPRRTHASPLSGSRYFSAVEMRLSKMCRSRAGNHATCSLSSSSRSTTCGAPTSRCCQRNTCSARGRTHGDHLVVGGQRRSWPASPCIRGQGRTSYSARLMSATSEERFSGRGRHQGCRAAIPFYTTRGTTASRSRKAPGNTWVLREVGRVQDGADGGAFPEPEFSAGSF
jgi:hypothetical protein